MFLSTITSDTGTGEVAKIYAEETEKLGLVMEATAAMTMRPEILPAWEKFHSTVRNGLTITERD